MTIDPRNPNHEPPIQSLATANPQSHTHCLTHQAEDFFLEMQLKNRTESSIETSRWHIDRFLKFLTDKGINEPDQLTKEVLREYHLDLMLSESERGGRRSVSTINRYLTSVRSFLAFLKDNDILSQGPEAGLVYATAPKKLPRVILSRDEMTALIEAPDITTVVGYRDRTIMELLYTTAIRRNECRSLKVSDINFQDRLIKVFGKGQKERMAPIGRIASKFLEVYVANVRPLLMNSNRSENHLFLSNLGRKMSQNLMGAFIERYAKQVGIIKRVTPHTFRHTCATLMLRNRAGIRHIQVLLGHESLESTQIYTHVAATDLREILEKYHPREQEE